MLLRRFKQDEQASTAVEFAIVGVPFVFMLIGLIEVSLMYTANSLLQDATADATRKIRTGQIQQSNEDPETLFRTILCDTAETFLDCANIQLEVLALPGGFNDATLDVPTFDEDGNLVSRGFSPGGSDDVVLIRTVYRYPLMTPFIGPLLADGGGHTKTMMTTMVIKTEPYEFGGGDDPEGAG